jgi:hypothetical protein
MDWFRGVFQRLKISVYGPRLSEMFSMSFGQIEMPGLPHIANTTVLARIAVNKSCVFQKLGRPLRGSSTFNPFIIPYSRPNVKKNRCPLKCPLFFSTKPPEKGGFVTQNIRFSTQRVRRMSALMSAYAQLRPLDATKMLRVTFTIMNAIPFKVSNPLPYTI